ncbi:hypothetical protein TCAL_00544 [Tigriopus californicus]|uniref:Uncharacterized protein n=1 Tax=Tigriopus californicus TaxID=6832 RepID=A0A553PCW7_TIGCA|nr:hypothetical protein TCAL_00544 [Tigriopus californicus]|eukprot:TCALIF_00544-PA protein Name:"Protein of unknown function" AED:0.00 eAED:0.00 QI:119/1/1/1/0.5/0.33/3/78/82
MKGNKWEHFNLDYYASKPHVTKDMVVDVAEDLQDGALHDMKEVRKRLEQAEKRLERAQDRLYQSQERLFKVLDKRSSQTKPN